MNVSNRSTWGRAVAVVALVLAFGVAGTAWAAPSDPTLSLSALKTKLDASASGTLAGYFKTVDKGSTIENIPVTIVAITGGATANSSLIMFEATGPQIDKFGGIVAGMSGSPVYVKDGGKDKVVGAVSYGDYFTKGGTGLATPIEAMQQVQTSYAPQFLTLSKPVLTTDGVVHSVIVAPDPQNFSAEAQQGAFVAGKLSSVFIGGLDPNSPGYKLLSRVMAYRGESVVPLAARLAASPDTGDQSFTTPLVPGAAVAALESRGDMWIGGVGTVTYTDSDTVLAFGHPAFWAGPTSLFMTNAWIDGVWPSIYEPYKVARPTALRGAFTQDRQKAILGVVGQYPAETTLTAHAFDVDRGTSATSAVYMSEKLLDRGTADPWFVPGIDPITASLGVYVAGQNLMDAQETPGSADITTTVLASDGTTTYTVSIPNRIDSSYDVPLAAIQDAATAINTIQQVSADGVHTAHLLSVDLTASFSTQRKWAQIVGVQLYRGLKVGANRVRVSTIEYGKAGTQTVDATVTIPSGTSLNGNLVAISQSALAQSAMWNSSGAVGYSTSWFDPGVTVYLPSMASQKSLADAASALNAIQPNNALTVAFVPTTDNYYYAGLGPNAIVTNLPLKPVFNGSATIAISKITATAEPSTVGYGGRSVITGVLSGPSAGATVAVYATPAGGAEHYVGTFTTSDIDEGVGFKATVGPLRTNTTFRLHYDGSSMYSAADAVVKVKAQAHVALGSSAIRVNSGSYVTLKAIVWPSATAGGQVVFEYSDYPRHWRTITTKTLAGGTSTATASAAWRVVAGTHSVRARYLGGVTNAASTSGVVAITGR